MARPKASRRAKKRAQPATTRLRYVAQRGEKANRPTTDEANLLPPILLTTGNTQPGLAG